MESVNTDFCMLDIHDFMEQIMITLLKQVWVFSGCSYWIYFIQVQYEDIKHKIKKDKMIYLKLKENAPQR